MSRRQATVAAAIAVVALGSAGPARAEPQDFLNVARDAVDPETVRVVREGAGAGVDVALDERRTDCPELNLGVAGLAGGRETEEQRLVRSLPDRGNGLRPGDRSDAPAGLPARVYFKTRNESFSRRYYFVTRGGRLYYKSNAERTGIEQPWKRLALPRCFEGDVREIALDDDELIAIDGERRVYTMDGALGDPALFNWTARWGAPLWQGAGWRLPRGIGAWAWSVLSLPEDRVYRDPAGNDFGVGEAKVSHLWSLRSGGRRLIFNDPWLPRDDSYEVCGPHRGRFRAVNMAASASTVFVIGRYGDMFTRVYDFDQSGHNPLFENYSYDDQRGRSEPAIQLPAHPWVRQPKIRGRVTSLITIEKAGRGDPIGRTLRVEGRDRSGATGFWEKDIAAPAWRFVRTGMPLCGRRLANPRRDSSRKGLAPGEDSRYGGAGDGWTGALENFSLHCSPARLTVRPAGGAPFRLRLHAIPSIRQKPRARDLDENTIHLSGAIEAPRALLADLPRRDPATRDFIAQRLGNRRFTPVDVEATRGEIVVRQLGWRFILTR